MRCIPMDDESLEHQMELDRLRLQVARERAIEIVKDYGWKESDEHFWYHVEDETKRQWDEEWEREMEKENVRLGEMTESYETSAV